MATSTRDSQPKPQIKKESRMEFRSTPEQKELIERAAALRGESVTDFVRSTVLERAAQAVHEHQVTRLSMRDWKRFERLIDEAAPPNARLREAKERYEEIISSSEGL
ncbi:MAG TPA: DUF1778 domain-containing protein [Rhodothermales bacterium]|nr:DUF1778 domain-containing protein [Rhodothermales bacterium]